MNTASVSYSRGESLRRAAGAMLQTLGGAEIKLRVSAPLGALDGRGLGLQQYECGEVHFASAVVRQVSPAPMAKWEVLLAATQVEEKLGPDPEAIGIALRAGSVMLWKERVLRIESVSTEQFGESEHLYRITLGE